MSIINTDKQIEIVVTFEYIYMVVSSFALNWILYHMKNLGIYYANTDTEKSHVNSR